jgi:hypothetical protein
MNKLIFFACLLALSLPFSGHAQKAKPKPANSKDAPANKKWGLTWETPKNWTRATAADGLKFSSKDDNDYMLIKGFDLPATAEAKEAIITKFANEEADMADYAEFIKQSKTTSLNGLQVRIFEDDEQPDTEEAEDPEDYEGYWTKIIVIEHNNKLVLISLSETYMRRRKGEKDFDNIYKSIQKEK